MSNIGQIMRNRFPHWTKVRKDSSSNAAILLNTIGKAIEDEKSSLYKIEHQLNPLHGWPVNEPGHLFLFNAFESEKVQTLLNEIRELTSFSLVGTRDNISINLQEVVNYDSLCIALPTSLNSIKIENVTNYLLKELNDDSFNHHVNDIFYFNIPKKICFYISDVVAFKQIIDKHPSENKILISGIDVYGKRTQETILIENEGYYQSKNFYIKLCPLEEEAKYSVVKSDSIVVLGVKGNIKVLQLPIKIDLKKHHCHFSVLKTDHINDSFSKKETYLTLKNNRESKDNESYNTLSYIHRMYDYGYNYINEYNDLSKDHFELTKFKQVLLDSGNNSITIEDYCFDYTRNLLTTISRDNKIRWYQIRETPFVVKEYPRTSKTSYSLSSVNQRVSLYDTEKIYLDYERPKGNISFFFIAKRTPSKKTNTINTNKYEFEYLQSDKITWSDSIHVFTKKQSSSNILNNIYFNNEFTEIGQHDFYCFSFMGNESTSLIRDFKDDLIDESLFKMKVNKLLEQTRQTSLFINTYSIMCEYNIPILELDCPVDVSNEDDYEVGLFYQNCENTLYVVKQFVNTCEVHEIKEYKDYFLYDYQNNICALLEEYESLTLTLENNEVESISYD